MNLTFKIIDEADDDPVMEENIGKRSGENVLYS